MGTKPVKNFTTNCSIYLGPQPPQTESKLLSFSFLIKTSICSFGFSLTILPISIDAFIAAIVAPAARAALKWYSSQG
jgi:hypothetical protein